METPNRRLYRSRTDRTLLGVCGGLGEYLGIDPVVVRLGWVAVTLFSAVAPGVLAYLAAWLIVPEEPARDWTAAPAGGEHRPTP